MKVCFDINLYEFNAWEGAINTKRKIIDAGKATEFENYIEDRYPDGISETALNDILWFDSDDILNYLEIEIED